MRLAFGFSVFKEIVNWIQSNTSNSCIWNFTKENKMFPPRDGCCAVTCCWRSIRPWNSGNFCLNRQLYKAEIKSSFSCLLTCTCIRKHLLTASMFKSFTANMLSSFYLYWMCFEDWNLNARDKEAELWEEMHSRKKPHNSHNCLKQFSEVWVILVIWNNASVFRGHFVTKAVFLYWCLDCPSCLAHLK